MKKIVAGIVIADEYEFDPFKEFASQYGCSEIKLRGNEAISFEFSDRLTVYAVKCGIGKVNASSATSFLIADNSCDMILNIGLSGAIADVRRGDIVAGSEYIECDFDLTAIGRELGEKPGQDYLYRCDDRLFSLAKKCRIDKFCRLGTGDIFLADKNLKQKFKSVFDISAFDMETAAIASVCHKSGVPFLAVRKISDDCEEGAQESYNEMNNRAEIHLSEVLGGLLEEISVNY